MEAFDWLPFLQKFSALLLEDDMCNLQEHGVCQMPEDAHHRGYMGFPGATEQQISATEARLGIRLPPSYYTFLQASNGWEEMGPSFPGRLWPVEQVEWLRVRSQEVIDIWGTSHLSLAEHLAYQGSDDGALYFNGAYMQNCLEVSSWGDACMVFLCPEVTTAEGEWECWKLASWYPGVARYPSFQAWMVESCLQLQREVR
ncbi:MAG: SMI1/KNR4 family protein [Gemmatimonadaceae bacterium]|nr:SMI1/KNR4 family protein [Gloeobacterales cyanobacterium ES-bin-141]